MQALRHPTSGRTASGYNSAPTSARYSRPSFAEGSYLEESDSRSGRTLSRYRIGAVLGKGGFAKCYEATDCDTNAVLAVKVIDRGTLAKSGLQSKLHSEIAIHRHMSHLNIVKFYKSFQDTWNVYIILEKCSNQTLMEISRLRPRFSVAETQHIMLQTINAISYMHQEGVIHRDLKLGNMMMDVEMNVKIGDFGLAAELQFDGERKRTVCGTPNYIAPEVLDGGRAGHSFEADVWSLGVILFTLLIGEPPFQTNDVKITYNRIRQCRFSFPPSLGISSAAKDLIAKLLVCNPTKRPSLAEVRVHPFLNNAPSSAPMSLFTDSQRRRYEAHKAAMAQNNNNNNNGGAAATGKGGPAPLAREPLRQLYSAQTNAAAQIPPAAPKSSPTTSPTTTSAPASFSPAAPESAPNSRPTSNINTPRLSGAGIGSAPGSAATSAGTSPTTTTTNADGSPAVWVVSYADFSEKYGVACRMSDGNTAVYYNDSTKLVWEVNSSRATYAIRVREPGPHGTVVAREQKQDISMDSPPEDLTKKITLIKYFKSYLNKNPAVVTCSPYTSSSGSSTPSTPTSSSAAPMPYVKQWRKCANDAIAFVLSDRTFQMCFPSLGEVLLPADSSLATFTDSNGKRTTQTSTAVPRDSEFGKALKTTVEQRTEMKA